MKMLVWKLHGAKKSSGKIDTDRRRSDRTEQQAADSYDEEDLGETRKT